METSRNDMLGKVRVAIILQDIILRVGKLKDHRFFCGSITYVLFMTTVISALTCVSYANP